MRHTDQRNKMRAILAGSASLRQQFGVGYVRIRKFKEVYRIALGQVKNVYPHACFALDDRGITLRNSPPPVARRILNGLSSFKVRLTLLPETARG